MATLTRIYLVHNGGTDRLVRAENSTQARNHVARESIAVRVASQDDLLELAGTVKVEVAGEEPSE